MRDCAASRSRAARAPRRRSAARCRTASVRAGTRCCRRARTARARSRARSSDRPCADPAARSAAGRRASAAPTRPSSRDASSCRRWPTACERSADSAAICRRSLKRHVRHGQTSRRSRLARAGCNDGSSPRISFRLPPLRGARQGRASALAVRRLPGRRNQRAADEARGVESVEPGQLWSLVGADGTASVRRSPSTVSQSAAIPHSPAAIGARANCDRCVQKALDLEGAFFRLERARAVDERAPGLRQVARRCRGGATAARPAPRRHRNASGAGCRGGGGSFRSTCRAHRAAPRRKVRPGVQVAASASTSCALSCSRSRLALQPLQPAQPQGRPP